jgi:hypothetical protein
MNNRGGGARAPSLWLTIVRQSGVLLLTSGIALALLAPLEMHVFSYFAEGGRFAYPGFGYGSFMFANLAAQVLGYTALAALLIPLGYGHLLARRWIATLGEALLQVWVVAGLPFVLAFLAVLFASKDVSLPAGIAVTALVASAYPVLPWAGRRFYRSAGVRRALATDPGPPCWIDGIPPATLALATLYGLLIIAHLVLIMLRGLFPLYGAWVTGLTGVIGLDLSIALLIVLIWGTLRQARWARWVGLVAVVAGAVSWTVSLAASSWSELLTVLALPPYEVEFLDGVPLQGWRLALIVAMPVGLLLVQIVRAGREGRGKHEAPENA